MVAPPASSPAPATGFARVLVVTADRLIYHLGRHWLAVLNAAAGVYAGLPVLAPLLEGLGMSGLGQFVFRMYGVACHQRPGRSFFILGHQVAYCQRDTAMYGAIFLAGLVYALVRRRVRPPRLRSYLALLLPLLVDGGGQLAGLWESRWWSRTLTGGLAGAATVWLAYPYFDLAFAQVRGEIEARFRRSGLQMGLLDSTRGAAPGERKEAQGA